MGKHDRCSRCTAYDVLNWEAGARRENERASERASKGPSEQASKRTSANSKREESGAVRPTGLTAGRARPSYVELGSAIVGPPPASQTTNSRLTPAGRVRAFLPVPQAATKRSTVLAAAAAAVSSLHFTRLAFSFTHSLSPSHLANKLSRPFSQDYFFLSFSPLNERERLG